MKERPKPRENWQSVIKGSRKNFKREDYLNILRELDIPSTDEIVKKIIDVQAQYCDEMQLINDRPHMTEVCAMMRKIIKHGKKYKEWLRKMDDESLLKMAVVKGDIYFMDDIGMSERIERSLEDVVNITGIAGLVLKDWELSKKERNPGRPFNLPIRTYIARLARVFEEATGKKATVTYDNYSETYTGKFFAFVSCCHNKIPGHSHIANSTLASLTKEVTSPSRNTVKIS